MEDELRMEQVDSLDAREDALQRFSNEIAASSDNVEEGEA